MKFIKRHILNEASLFPNVQKIKSAGGLTKAPAGSALASSATKAINGQVSKVLADIIENLGINVVPFHSSLSQVKSNSCFSANSFERYNHNQKLFESEGAGLV